MSRLSDVQQWLSGLGLQIQTLPRLTQLLLSGCLTGICLMAVGGCESRVDDDVQLGDPITPGPADMSTDPVPGTGNNLNTTNPAGSSNADGADVTAAVCELVAIGDSGVSGTVNFEKQGDVIQIRGTVRGLTPGKHGFHVHEHGDLSDTAEGTSAGGHFDPHGKPHGKPGDEERHVGDLGNIEANDDGVAEISIDDSLIALHGEHSIVGRSLVIHAKEDTFGQPTGDAGGRVAFGLIEASQDTQ